MKDLYIAKEAKSSKTKKKNTSTATTTMMKNDTQCKKKKKKIQEIRRENQNRRVKCKKKKKNCLMKKKRPYKSALHFNKFFFSQFTIRNPPTRSSISNTYALKCFNLFAGAYYFTLKMRIHISLITRDDQYITIDN